MQTKLVKLLRYPGGKQKLLNFLLPFLPIADDIVGKYVEPFVGGGAVFFALNPTKAILSDLNVELINLYKALRKGPSKVWKYYSSFPSTKKSYYEIRDNKLGNFNLFKRAARTLYLNRTCFKGMWRQNAKGKFNVGYGGQERRWAINKKNLMEVSRYLKKAWLRTSDFEKVINRTRYGDFIFADPPYKPLQKEMNHSHYLHSKFTFKDHQRLANALLKASERGVKWAVTTSSHTDILKLFKGSTMIWIKKGTGTRLGIFSENSGEVLVCNYKINLNNNEAVFYRSSFSESSFASTFRFS